MQVTLKQLGRMFDDIYRLGRDMERDLRCKFCGSLDVVRYGRFRGVQRYFCKKCKRKFADNAAIPHMKTPAKQVAAALSMYYGGMSLNAIRRHLQQQYGNRPSDSTVYGWLVRFTKVAVDSAKAYKLKVGDVWVADETVLKIEGENIWFWDIIDIKTRFLLASHMSLSRTTRDAKVLMERAAQRAGKAPRVIITDKLQAYLDGIELTFGAETKHIPAKAFTAQPNTTIIERFHGSLKSRTKVMRGLKKRETAKLLMAGWLVHYNFFRPHESLKGLTPSQKAGIDFPLKDWAGVVTKGSGLAPQNYGASYCTIEHSTFRAPTTRKRKARKRGVATLGRVKNL